MVCPLFGRGLAYTAAHVNTTLASLSHSSTPPPFPTHTHSLSLHFLDLRRGGVVMMGLVVVVELEYSGGVAC